VAKYRADVDEPRYYPDLGVTVNPADEIDLPNGVVAAGLTLIETPAKVSKTKTDETPATDATVSDATDTEGVTN
jgi:hypothetical protein